MEERIGRHESTCDEGSVVRGVSLMAGLTVG